MPQVIKVLKSAVTAIASPQAEARPRSIPAPGSAFFTVWAPDPVGVALGTGFMRFQTRFGLDGLAKMNGDTLEVLAVHTMRPRQGRFRDFITAAKSTFKAVAVLDIWEPIVEAALTRYGFTKFSRTESDGERLTGMIWRNDEASHITTKAD